jgi:hypothetical protein
MPTDLGPPAPDRRSHHEGSHPGRSMWDPELVASPDTAFPRVASDKRTVLDMVAGDRRRPARSNNGMDSITSSCGRWLTRPSSMGAVGPTTSTLGLSPVVELGAAAATSPGRTGYAERRHCARAPPQSNLRGKSDSVMLALRALRVCDRQRRHARDTRKGGARA